MIIDKNDENYDDNNNSNNDYNNDDYFHKND